MKTELVGGPGHSISSFHEDDVRNGNGINVNDTERWVSALGGSALALFGLTRGSLAGLGLALTGGAMVFRGVTGHCFCYEAFGVNTANGKAPATSVSAGHGEKLEKTITINRPAGELFQYWRKLENLPRFMSHLESVTELDSRRSRWVAKGPLGVNVSWDAEIINETENELIAWRSLEGSDVDTAGSVHFHPAPGGRGTEIKVILKYDPPAGKAGAAVASLLGESPEQQIQEDLRRFKQLIEAGEVATTRGQTSCRKPKDESSRR